MPNHNTIEIGFNAGRVCEAIAKQFDSIPMNI